MNFVKTIFILIGLLTYSTLKSQDLEQHRWKNRILVIHLIDENSNQYEQQLNELFNAGKGLEERKLVLYTVVNNQYQYTCFKKQKSDDWKPINTLDQRFQNNETPFKITLIGLDGGVKLQKTEMLTKNDLFNIIDSMPMRAAELRKY